ncbi:MAG: ABC transporter permease [Candidatus Hodarchaeales archaeon]|jgi:peptide/nickel transport system permease protein
MVTVPSKPKIAVEHLVPSLRLRYKIRFQRFWNLYTETPFGLIGLYLVAIFLIVALFAPFLAPFDPTKLNTGNKWENPNLSHPLGTDRLGRDIFSQLVWGTTISLTIGLAAAFMTVVIGTAIGLVAGYYGGYIDQILMRITDFFIIIPGLPLMIVLLLFWGGGNFMIIIAIGIVAWTGVARVVRSETLSIKERAFIEATRAIGAKDRHIIFNHILPNVFPLIFANAILAVVGAIIAEAGLSFLGFGDTEQWSWGRILFESRRMGENALLQGHWWYFIPPGLCIMLLALGFSLMSFSLNEVLNPRLRRR